MNNSTVSVLIVEDDYIIADLFCMEIEDMGLRVCGIADTALKAVALAREHRPTLVLMDFRLKGTEDGVDASIAIHEAIGSKVIFITGSQEPTTLDRIKLDHATAVLIKPLYGYQLRAAVESALSIGQQGRSSLRPASRSP
jgi:AmiR/NasT family two-component response regulator